MSITWIVSANRTLASIYQSNGIGQKWTLLKSIDHPEGKLKNSEMTSDVGGRNNTAAGQGSRPAVLWSTSPHEADANLFARIIGKELAEGRTHQRYDRFVLVAPPEFLGKLRESLDARVHEKILETIAKDYSGLSMEEIREKVNGIVLV
ncbi:MAG: host attachment protein [Leptospirillum sp.]|jgi:protein required for attachment to host cells|nr:host attachment protein [Nitrospiraceae bacterium]